jgi:hypothetical protein
MADYISEDFLQVLEVSASLFNPKIYFYRNIESYVNVRGNSMRLKQLAND